MPEWKTEIKKRLAGLHLEPERESEILDDCPATSKTATTTFAHPERHGKTRSAR